jgi:chromatin structure-remodeling complex subunit RSC1/2
VFQCYIFKLTSFVLTRCDLAGKAKQFDRDPETNEVLWFSAPPMNVARAPPPKHSLAYLHFLATKRKKTVQSPASDGDAMDTD